MAQLTEKTMTPREALVETVNTLSAINVPAELVEQVGIPVFYSIRNLKNVITALDKMFEEKKEEEPQETEGDEPDVQ